jgi:hypothetical protein
MKKTYWRIEVEEGIQLKSSMIVSSGQITHHGIVKLIYLLFSKSILDDEEILSIVCKKNSLRFKDLVQYVFNRDNSKKKCGYYYLAQSSGISICINLVYDDELTPSELGRLH